MIDLDRAGGVPAVLSRLSRALNDSETVDGKGISKIAAEAVGGAGQLDEVQRVAGGNGAQRNCRPVERLVRHFLQSAYRSAQKSPDLCA